MAFINFATHPAALVVSIEGKEMSAPGQKSLRWYWLVLLWFVAAIVMASHRPSSLFHPAFWAEDGNIWFRQAYQDGPLAQLTHTQGGYLQLLSRLLADVGLLVPLHLAPLVMNGLAVLIDAIPIVFLLSRRGADWATLRTRGVMAVFYLCLPNTAEWHANATGTQWVSALLGVMVVLARLPSGWRGRALDLALLAIVGLTGPFSIFLVPIAAAMAWLRRERWRVVYAAWLVLFAVVQAAEIVHTRATARAHQPLGASVPLLIHIVAARIFVGAVAGPFSPLSSLSIPILLPLLLFSGCCALVGVGLWRGRLELRLFALFSVEFFAAVLSSPLISPTGSQWLAMLHAWNSRYYLFPMLAFLFCVLCVAGRGPTRWLRVCAMLLLCLFPFGAVHGWPDRRDRNAAIRASEGFERGARRFEAASRGTTVTLPGDPGPDWDTTLVKH